ncbi:MAG: DUF5615 family PIN-like protein [Deltaproteobacteria bacterium]|nr:DUF5615 family PIN-like protein [Deltaproteobacteria bacterium]
MRILADENVPGPVIRALRDRGHDVLSVKEAAPGADDRTVLRLAQEESRLLVTFDKDFGELAFRAGLPAPCGVVLFRLSGSHAVEDNARVLAVLESRDEWAGRFAVVTDTLIRLRPLPGT